MSRMNNSLNTKMARQMLELVLESIDSQEITRTSPEAENVAQAQRALAAEITRTISESRTIEELIHCEMVLQRLDKSFAGTKRDVTSIENAERDYRQLAETIEQMRSSAEAYFKANLSIREVGGDARKMPRGRGLQQISANKARMQNRASFAPEEQRIVLDARIKLAEKTEGMLRTLHVNLVKEVYT